MLPTGFPYFSFRFVSLRFFLFFSFSFVSFLFSPFCFRFFAFRFFCVSFRYFSPCFLFVFFLSVSFRFFSFLFVFFSVSQFTGTRKSRSSRTKLELELYYVTTNSYTKFQVNISNDVREKSGKLNFSKRAITPVKVGQA